MHGDVSVVQNTAGLYCEGLQHMVLATKDNALSLADRCRDICYSDVYCTAWQYGNAGCHYGNLTNCNGAAPTLTAGEQILHYCPEEGYGAAQGEENHWWTNPLHYLPMLAIVLALGCICHHLFCAQTRQMKKTRAVKGPDFFYRPDIHLEIPDEENEPLVGVEKAWVVPPPQPATPVLDSVNEVSGELRLV